MGNFRWFSVIALALALPLAPLPAAGEKQTVCTVTVNSVDEKEAFRHHLPSSKYQFVELVEPNRPDWLTSACHAGVACDVLIISGHYDGGNEFFSDRLDVHEFLPVHEMERVSCNDSCRSLFGRLKEVYLFGCNTLNPHPLSNVSTEVIQGLVREGRSLKDATLEVQSLNAAHWQSSLERMRQVFQDVPVIYGFSARAPLGPLAAATLHRYFQTTGTDEIAQGRSSRRLLNHFMAPYTMAATRGMTDADPHAQARQEMCQFVDDRLSVTARLAFIHQLLQRHWGELRIYLARIEQLMKDLDQPTRQLPTVDRALKTIAGDTTARANFMERLHAEDQAPIRSRLVHLARDLGWLSENERRNELVLMLHQVQARAVVGLSEVELACSLNQRRELDGLFNRRAMPPSLADDASHTAMRACLGSADAHSRILQRLVSQNEADVQMAQLYLRHRPITEPAELRQLAAAIMSMEPSAAQVLALEALGRHYVTDDQILNMLISHFSETPSWPVRSAIAGILLRADLRSIATAQLMETLHNSKSATSDSSVLDALLHRLNQPSGTD